MTTHYSKIRVGVVFLLFVMTFVLFFTRLLYVQVVMGEELKQKAEHQFQELIELPAARGEIYDVRGYKVAVNTNFTSLFAYPLGPDDVDRSYRELTSILGRNLRDLKRKYNLQPNRFRWIKRGLTPVELERFEKSAVGCGLFLREEPTRCYPYGRVGQTLLGFVDIDNVGRSGVEMEMNDRLKGMPGRSMIQKDGKGVGYRISEVPLKAPQSGVSIVLTIDWDKQQIVEKELALAVEKYKAKAGMALFLDPRTGAIIAAADCNPAADSTRKPMKLEAVAGVFEPGSVFKLVTAAAALETGKVQPTDRFYGEGGTWYLGEHKLRDDHKFEWLTFRESFENSSNIITGKVAYEVGPERVFAMAKKLGFGRKTRCGLNSEAKGVLVAPNRWTQFTTATFAIGHGVSVTALQMAQAFAIVASGGYLNQPFLVKGYINQDGAVVERHEVHPVKILDDATVATLKSFMEGVVERGTGKPLKPTPFKIAGKTGTAQKPNFETGGYYENRFMGSFAGYFPADSPVVAGIVVLDEAEPIHYGGYTAGPTFKEIAIKFAAIDNYQGIAVMNTDKDSAASKEPARDTARPQVMLCDLTNVSRGEADYTLAKLGLAAAFSGSGDRIIRTCPAPLTQVSEGDTVRCILNAVGTERFAPDLRGMTLREAIAVLDRYGISFTCDGAGRIVSQVPEAGTAMSLAEGMSLVCARDKESDHRTEGNGQDSAGVAPDRQ